MTGFLRILLALVLLAGGGVVLYAAITPGRLPEAALIDIGVGDAGAGETWFWSGGCASCHAEAKAKGEDRLKLGGGQVLKTEFGDFVTPNISMDAVDGIGAWSFADFANAMTHGVSPDGLPYYPAFPYTSYSRMELSDIADLWAYFQTLPPVAGKAPDHDLKFPFSVRRGIGLWQTAFFRDGPAVEAVPDDPLIARGKYLVEGPGHCGECHTARNLAGATDYGRWLAGAPAAEGDGFVPNITSGEGGIGGWSAGDIAYYLETGFTPEFDSVGGAMVEVQQNMAMLEPGDRDAVAAYLKWIPPHAAARRAPADD